MVRADIAKHFENRFKVAPDFIVRAPGRVNLIGEHIDYSDYGVLPMAVTQSIFAAVRVDSDRKEIILANGNPEFLEFSTKTTGFKIDARIPSWYNYFFCGYLGMKEYLVEHKLLGDQDLEKGFDVVILGTIPPSSGLSSSSALVVCAALVTLKALTGREFDLVSRTAVAEIAAKCERYIGTEGGGMDQAISCLAEAGKAKHVTFNPLKTVSVTLPEGVSFVVANCCVEANKAAFSYYNERVVECRLASQVLALKLGLDWRSVRKLGQLQKMLSVSLESMLEKVEEHLHVVAYSKEELCTILSVNEQELSQISLNNSNTAQMTHFKLYDRAKHVYSEALRVIQFAEICAKAHDSGTNGIHVIRKLGDLMDQSHASCRRLFECSCVELDELVAVNKQAGAYGSRLTGAGWGGCTVSLVAAADADQFLENVKTAFFDIDERRKAKLDTALFVTQPSGGAEFFTPE